VTVASTLLDDRYLLDEEIGVGGFCEVWRATDSVLARSPAGRAGCVASSPRRAIGARRAPVGTRLDTAERQRAVPSRARARWPGRWLPLYAAVVALGALICMVLLAVAGLAGLSVLVR
jgi:hypothetical protein